MTIVGSTSACLSALWQVVFALVVWECWQRHGVWSKAALGALPEPGRGMGMAPWVPRWVRAKTCRAGLGGMELSRGKLIHKYFLFQTRNSARSRSQSTWKHPALPSTSPCSSEADWGQQCPLVLVLALNISSMVLSASSFRLALFSQQLSSKLSFPLPSFSFFFLQ